MKVKTQVLKELVSKAIVGCGNDKSIPMTNYIAIAVQDNLLKLTTTDYTNYLEVSTPVEEDDFYCIAVAERFSKLIGKLTSEYVTLTDEGSRLKVSANGEYSIDLLEDENGERVKFIELPEIKAKKPKTLSKEVVEEVIHTVKPSLAVTYERPYLTNYYVGEVICGSNGSFVSEYKDKLLDKSQLISAPLMDLISTFDEDVIKYEIGESYLLFVTDTMKIYSKCEIGEGDYAIDRIKQFLKTKFDKYVKVDKDLLLSAIDRVALFTDKTDNRALKLIFNDGNITIKNVKDNSYEVVACTEVKAKEPDFELYINADMLTVQLKAYNGEVVKIGYGHDHVISLTTDKTTQIVALMSVNK